MYDVEIHSVVLKILFVFHTFGMVKNENENVEQESTLRKIARKLLCLITTISLFVSLLFGAILSGDNTSIFSLVVAIPTAVIAVKQIYIFWNEKQFYQLLNGICVHSFPAKDQSTECVEKLKKFMKFVQFYSLMVITSFILLLISTLPAFSNERRLPLVVWLPFDWKDSHILFWIAYAFVVIGLTINIAVIIFTTIIWYLMLNCSIKYEVLGDQFRNMGAVTSVAGKKSYISEAEKQKLDLEQRQEQQQLVLQELIRLIKNHRSTYKYFVFDTYHFRKGNKKPFFE